ncbi:MAG: translation initiation factor IF-3 [candidate division WOR-3 bacterium]
MKQERIRVNFLIKSPYVRVIGPDKKQIGIMPTREAMELAKRQGLDLVEISPNADPPVCYITDFGKYMYELKQKQREAKKKQKTTELKEVRLSYKIDDHDYQTKLRKIKEILNAKNRVKVVLKMRGREALYKDKALALLDRLTNDLSGIGQPEGVPRSLGEAGKIIQLTYLPK